MPMRTLFEWILRYNHLAIVFGLIGVTLLAWTYLAMAAADMSSMASISNALTMERSKPWTSLDFLMMGTMWAVMMVAMMLPSAAPMVLLYATVIRKQGAKGHGFAPTSIFTSGYLAAWGVFSLAATVMQWGLDQTTLLSPSMVISSPVLGGLLLMTAGLYQATPLKQACLAHCRSPITFLSMSWRPGRCGAFFMGLHHGAYCVGCCWFLMCLLFLGGVMNLLWVAAIAFYVLLEKVVPHGPILARITGALLAISGIGIIVLHYVS